MRGGGSSHCCHPLGTHSELAHQGRARRWLEPGLGSLPCGAGTSRRRAHALRLVQELKPKRGQASGRVAQSRRAHARELVQVFKPKSPRHVTFPAWFPFWPRSTTIFERSSTDNFSQKKMHRRENNNNNNNNKICIKTYTPLNWVYRSDLIKKKKLTNIKSK